VVKDRRKPVVRETASLDEAKTHLSALVERPPLSFRLRSSDCTVARRLKKV